MDANPITEFDEARSLQLLGTVSLGRLVTVSEGRADIFPVNYALSPEGKLFFRTAEGSKLAGITVHPDVVFQVDHIEGDVVKELEHLGRGIGQKVGQNSLGGRQVLVRNFKGLGVDFTKGPDSTSVD